MRIAFGWPTRWDAPFIAHGRGDVNRTPYRALRDGSPPYFAAGQVILRNLSDETAQFARHSGILARKCRYSHDVESINFLLGAIHGMLFSAFARGALPYILRAVPYILGLCPVSLPRALK